MASQDEYPPLLPPGLHHKSLDELQAMVVAAFPLSTRRPMLWANFLSLVAKIKKAGLSGDLWIDGSFLTEKIEPDDIDLVFDLPVSLIENASPEQERLLGDLSNGAFRKHEHLHTFVMFTAPAGHSEHSASVRIHEQWKKDFGLSYIKKEPKGIVVVQVFP